MAIVLSEHDFTVFMGRFPFEKKWLGTQFKIDGKKPLPIKTRTGTDVVIIYSDTKVYMKSKGFFLAELLKNHEIGVYVDVDNEDAVSPSALTLQYELWKR
jgi:hypothetical protein